MNKFIATVVALMFGLGSISGFASDAMNKDNKAAKKEMKHEKKETKKNEKKK